MKISEQQNDLIEKISQYENIIIAKHINPDWDAQGSALGLKEIILDNFENKKVFVVGHKFNEDKLFEDEQLLTEEIISNSLMITVDVANFERIDFIAKDNVKEIFKVDHHIEVDNYGDFKLVDESAIACTQVVTLFAHEKNLKISSSAATYLYYGLITDSGRFLYTKTNQETFKTASILFSCGAKMEEVYNDLYTQDLKIKKWMNKGFSMATYIEGYPMAYIKVKKTDHSEFELTEEEVKLALNALAGIKEILVWFIAYESETTDKIKVSIRSRAYDINKVAQMYNGGGHKLASGAKLNNFEEVENIVNDLKKLIDNEL
ncbi:bifunctional oligoribonuclease and PAP phosphatase NrnA [Spiroplasma chinense]|uniref:Bifunctional oligoribonuclease and PAP phosphatase NrnA n=1 Tax=Spiroplasma chinense TaxID=216932 RepID=A0A5B9Y5K9_9MOLU|nr:bifunctional oligoribonuclease/PAP phosphatase NrnA [Spiroplasma chinense]QEH62374.1 bifunctional oligoribonuclease and PAP phosphatase NrnA [Spiroplasma chinense]